MNKFNVNDVDKYIQKENDGDLWSLRYKTPCVRALYIHIPFCASKCKYCDFASFATLPNTDLVRRYVISLQHEIEHMSWLGLLDETTTVYIGGGTPTFAGDWLWWLCQTISSNLNVSEMTVEANPESTNPYILNKLKEHGVTRISLGVQSLQDDELSLLGRIHDAKQARDAIKLAQSFNFDVSCDLMCAIPKQTLESFEDTLNQVIDLNPSHVSVYPLQIEDSTPFGRAVANGSMQEPEDFVMADCMELAKTKLEQAKYHRYEVASYAKSGFECAHNKVYWSGQPYLGLGSSAASCLSVEGYLKLKSVVSKLPDIKLDTYRVRIKCLSDRFSVAESTCIDQLNFEVEFLNKTQAIAEDLMLSARLVKGIPSALIDIAQDVYDEKCLDTTIKYLIDEKLVVRSLDNYLRPTDKGWLLGNELYGALWDLAQGSTEVFTV